MSLALICGFGLARCAFDPLGDSSLGESIFSSSCDGANPGIGCPGDPVRLYCVQRGACSVEEVKPCVTREFEYTTRLDQNGACGTVKLPYEAWLDCEARAECSGLDGAPCLAALQAYQEAVASAPSCPPPPLRAQAGSLDGGSEDKPDGGSVDCSSEEGNVCPKAGCINKFARSYCATAKTCGKQNDDDLCRLNVQTYLCAINNKGANCGDATLFYQQWLECEGGLTAQCSAFDDTSGSAPCDAKWSSFDAALRSSGCNYDAPKKVHEF